MPFQRDKELGRASTSLLACSFVLAAGVVTCAFIALALAEDPSRPMLICSSTMLGVSVLLWLLRDKPKNKASERYSWLLKTKPPKYEHNYVPRLRRTHSTQPRGDIGPPTAEGVRELKQGLNTWVPSQSRGKLNSKRAQR